MTMNTLPRRSSLFMLLLLLLFTIPGHASEKRIGILVFDGVLTSDVTAPLEVFGAASKLSWFSRYTTITIGITEQKQITTEEGLILGVNTSIDDMPELDVLIVPSSYKMGPLLTNRPLIDFIIHASKHTKWIASNCAGAFLLAKAGLLDGKKATTWAGGESKLQRDFPHVQVQADTNYVIDGAIITSNGGVVSYQAALVLLQQMSSRQKAQQVADALQYTRLTSEPFYSAH